ncbi:MAG: UDP-N-acetylmuramoyl-L-alanine--D-glutamate ligase [Balneolaceae bacterium]|nr:MAG: UDP-N-acetylmuramoyl-L-alanine--D-glutamate ligase [Balneolaceae bacterium]
MMNVENRHITIAGAARSGVAAAILLREKGAIPFVTDSGTISDISRQRLIDLNIEFEEGAHSSRSLKGEFLILSPGIPTESSIAQHYLNEGKKIYSEIELASWFANPPLIAVTGSNGKTTVANWMAHIWKTAGKNYLLTGNIGNAFSEMILSSDDHATILLEVSSFQLDHIDQFRPDITILLNITEDHLDRYQNDFGKYAAAKLQITRNQNCENLFIYWQDDPILAKHAEELALKPDSPRLLAFSATREVTEGAFIRNGTLILKLQNQEEELMQIGEIGLTGKHNLQNGMAAALAARASEIRNEFIRESLRSFEGVSHRLEFVREYEGIRYVNDSKATNINSVWYALDSFQMPLALILGGRDKGNDYTLLEKQIRSKVHTVIAIGEARASIREQLGNIVPNFLEADSMKGAVKLARKSCKRGETILLSPACSSFDMFDNYEHRGNEFKQAVLNL